MGASESGMYGLHGAPVGFLLYTETYMQTWVQFFSYRVVMHCWCMTSWLWNACDLLWFLKILWLDFCFSLNQDKLEYRYELPVTSLSCVQVRFWLRMVRKTGGFCSTVGFCVGCERLHLIAAALYFMSRGDNLAGPGPRHIADVRYTLTE